MFLAALCILAALVAWMLAQLEPSLQRAVIVAIILGGPGSFVLLRVLAACIRLRELSKSTTPTATTPRRSREPRPALTVTTGEVATGRRMF
jgi:hypothetical protein